MKMLKDYDPQEVLRHIKDSVSHWQEMISWARRQPKDGDVTYSQMLVEIGQTWYGASCPLCLVFFDHEGYFENVLHEVGWECTQCPLTETTDNCSSNNSVWDLVHASRSWGEWVERAEDMIQVLEATERRWQAKVDKPS